MRQAFDENGNLLPIASLPDELALALGGIEHDQISGKDGPEGYTRKIKASDRMRALELLGKHLAMFTEVTEHKGLEGIEQRINAGWRRTRQKGNGEGETDGVRT